MSLGYFNLAIIFVCFDLEVLWFLPYCISMVLTKRLLIAICFLIYFWAIYLGLNHEINEITTKWFYG